MPGDPLNLSGGKKPPKYFELKKTAEKFLANRNSDVFKELLLNQQYEEKKRERKGPDVGPDVRTGEEQGG